MFSSKSSIVSGLTFRSLIHYEFIFVYGFRKCSSFILLHVALQFPQHHLLKRLSLPHCIFFLPLSKNKVSKGAGVYFWAFYLVPLVCISVFVPVPYCLDDCRFVEYTLFGNCKEQITFLVSCPVINKGRVRAGPPK